MAGGIVFLETPQLILDNLELGAPVFFTINNHIQFDISSVDDFF